MRRRKTNRILRFAVVAAAVVASPSVLANRGVDQSDSLRLPYLIGDGMVVQRNADIPVWGWAPPGESVIVTFAESEATGTANERGEWRVRFPARPTGGPYDVTVRSTSETRTFSNVMVGDVWVAAGQSNMEWPLKSATSALEEIAEAVDTMIRHFKVPRSWSYLPESELAGGEWAVASPETVGEFTAVGYFFAQELRKSIDVPIGIINSTWGGSAIEAWISAPSMGMSEQDQMVFEAQLRAEGQRTVAKLKGLVGEFGKQDAGLVDGVAHWANPALDDADWAMITVPGYWELAGYGGMDGVAWYRTTFRLTAEEATQEAILSLGPIDDSDITWVNGEMVGTMFDLYNRPRLYRVSPSVLRAGENTIAIRVEDPQGGGGIYGDAGLIYLEVGGVRRSLAGDWKFRPSSITVDLDDEKHHTRTLLYNKMLAPLFNVPVAGVIWYQGETNAQDSLAFVYRDQLKTMVRDWRAGWDLDSMPFFVVQLPNYMAVQPQPSESGWAVIRESQLRVLDLPNTGLAVTIDVGEGENLHPRNKKPVGIRLAKAALAIAYGEDIVYSGPIFKSMTILDGRAYVSFDHVGSGLEARREALGGFAVAGRDRRFVWANARIENDQVVVWHQDIVDPIAVRYAWASNPVKANLYNKEGLPASPFRTDEW